MPTVDFPKRWQEGACSCMSLFLVIAVSLFGTAINAQTSTTASPSQEHTPVLDNPQLSSFEVVSIRSSRSNEQSTLLLGLPDSYRATALPLMTTIMVAYAPQGESINRWTATQILNAPRWLKTDKYDVEARVDSAAMEAWQNQSASRELLKTMLQHMLTVRCKLAVHRTTRTVPAYALVPERGGPRLHVAKTTEPVPANAVQLGGGALLIPSEGRGVPEVGYVGTPMKTFAESLSSFTDRPVIDNTGLNGRYTFNLHASNAYLERSLQDPGPAVLWDLSTIGLKLISTTVLMDGFIIDRVERPTAN